MAIETYRSSGSTEPGRFLFAIGAGAIASGIGGAAYQFASSSIPLIYVRGLLTVVCAVGIAFIASKAAFVARSRSPLSAGLLGVLCALAAWTASWPVAYLRYTAAIPAEVEQERIPDLREQLSRSVHDLRNLLERARARGDGYLADPRLPTDPAPHVGRVPTVEEVRAALGFWDYLSISYDAGWVLGGTHDYAGLGHRRDGITISGLFVVAIWLVELLALCVAGGFAGSRTAAIPYCERCGRFAESVVVRQVQNADGRRIAKAADDGDLPTLLAIPRERERGGLATYRVRACPVCMEGGFLDVILGGHPNGDAAVPGIDNNIGDLRSGIARLEGALFRKFLGRHAPLVASAVLTSEQRDSLRGGKARRTGATVSEAGDQR